MGNGNLYIGLMSGTSADSIDAVIVDLSSKSPQLLATHSVDLANIKLPGQISIKAEIQALATAGDNEIHRMNQLDRTLGQLFAQAVNELLAKTELSSDNVIAIGSHGQTTRHYPASNRPVSNTPSTSSTPSSTNKELPYTVQVGDPNTIAQLTGITTVADFRRRDIALGGQGAPLVPAFHQAVFEKPGFSRAIVNIGGVANITVLSGNNSPLLGYDTGPGNGLMDKWIQQHHQLDYDEGGQWASQGTIIEALLNSLISTPYFAEPPPKSTGPELFNTEWLHQHLNAFPAANPADVQITLLELTAQTITQALKSHNTISNSNVSNGIPNEVFFCGGGVYNTALMQRLETLLHPMLIASTTQLGIPPEWVEATAFAWLAKQTLEGKPGNAPTVTGATEQAVLGAIFPGRNFRF